MGMGVKKGTVAVLCSCGGMLTLFLPLSWLLHLRQWSCDVLMTSRVPLDTAHVENMDASLSVFVSAKCPSQCFPCPAFPQMSLSPKSWSRMMQPHVCGLSCNLRSCKHVLLSREGGAMVGCCFNWDPKLH